MSVYNNGNLNNGPVNDAVEPNNNKPKKKGMTQQQIIILGVIAMSCLAVILGFAYSYFKDGNGSLFGSNNSSTGTGMTGVEVADEIEDSIIDYVSPETLEDWTAEAEESLDEYVADEDATAEGDDSLDADETTSDSSSNSNSNSDSNSGSTSTTPTTPSDTLGKGEWLAKYYDGGVLRYYGDGSVYDMTRNIWWTKTQWNDFMASITQ